MVTEYINSKKNVGRADFSDQFRKIIVTNVLDIT